MRARLLLWECGIFGYSRFGAVYAREILCIGLIIMIIVLKIVKGKWKDLYSSYRTGTSLMKNHLS